MSTEQNKAMDRRVYEEVWNGGNLAVIDELVAANYVDHDPQPTGALEGVEGLKQSVTMYRPPSPMSISRLRTKLPKGTRS